MAAKKIKIKKPPLSALDKFIYTALILSLFVGIFIGFSFFWLNVPDRIAFSDPAVVAHNGDSLFTTIFFCSLPMLIVLVIIIMVPLQMGLSKKQPIFGNKKFKVIGFQPMVRSYPIFTKAFRDNLSGKERKTIKTALTAWSISFAAALLILLLGLFPRDVLDERNNFIRYNSFNQVTAAEHINQAEQLIINIDRRSSRHRAYPVLELHFIFEEHTYILPLHGFREDDPAAVLEHMLYLKSFFRLGEYEITNADRLDWLLWDENFNARETELVYELFDYTDE